jgi:hypothetical protein
VERLLLQQDPRRERGGDSDGQNKNSDAVASRADYLSDHNANTEQQPSKDHDEEEELHPDNNSHNASSILPKP